MPVLKQNGYFVWTDRPRETEIWSSNCSIHVPLFTVVKLVEEYMRVASITTLSFKQPIYPINSVDVRSYKIKQGEYGLHCRVSSFVPSEFQQPPKSQCRVSLRG